jgi:5'-3' exonuclease
MNRYLLVDGPNITHAANNTKPLKVGNTQVQAVYGFLRILRSIVSTYGNVTPIVLWDGASWRKMEYPDYKANRNKPVEELTKAEIEQAEARKQATAQMPAIKKALELMGVAQVRAMNMEADDLAAILADRYVARGDKIVLVSGDRDWVQLVGDGIIWFDPIADRKIRKAEDVEKALGYTVGDFQQFLELKCLMGDAGDNISGVGGIGGKGAQDFLALYGTVANFSNMVLDKSIDVSKLHKKIRTFAESEEKQMIFQRNMRLMDLRTSARPAPINMQIDKGTPDIDRFRTFCDRFLFKSLTKDLSTWLSVFPAFHHLQEDLAA